jgi:KaiC/GvpD/RAD55 family RecA-like ATPase
MKSRRPDPNEDRLPPHSEAAEQAVLGCIFQSSHTCLPRAREVFGVTQPFYDLKHAKIFEVLANMFDEGIAIDGVTFHQRLKDLGNESERDTGGIAYWNTLPDKITSTANLDFYLQIVREKFVLRQSIAAAQRYISTVYTWEGTVEKMLENTSAEFNALAAAAHAQANPNALPPHVQPCSDFADQYMSQFFGKDAEEPGLPLPFRHENFPMKVRDGELTLLEGETKVGKSTILNWIALHMMHHGKKVFMASMEMKPETTLKVLASQLIGRNKLEDCQQHHNLAASALAWLNSRMVFYSFLGITQWRELLMAKRYAVEFLGCNFHITDSLMRLGIMDDDYAQQGQCVIAYESAAKELNYHEVLVNHLNAGKERGRGSQQVRDNAHNIWRVTRNAKKGEEVAELWNKRESDIRSKCFDEAAFQKELDKFKTKHDAKFALTNQRWPGSRQNGSVYLWFDRPSQQYRDDPNEPVGVNYLERWAPVKKKEKETP